MNTSSAGSAGSSNRALFRALAALAVACLAWAHCSDSPAEESQIKKDAKAAGHEIGSTARELGHDTKEAGKKVGHEAAKAGKTVGHAARDGAHELKRSIKGESASK